MADQEPTIVEAELIEPAPKPASKARSFSISMLCTGILLVIMSIVGFVWPGLTSVAIAIMLGCSFLISGIAGFIDFFMGGALRTFTGWMIFDNVVNLLLGLVFLMRPILSAFVLVCIIAGVVLAGGVAQIVFSFRMHKLGSRFWWAVLVGGILAIVISILMFMQPSLVIYYMCAFTMIYGILMAVFAFKMNKTLKSLTGN